MRRNINHCRGVMLDSKIVNHRKGEPTIGRELSEAILRRFFYRRPLWSLMERIQLSYMHWKKECKVEYSK